MADYHPESTPIETTQESAVTPLATPAEAMRESVVTPAANPGVKRQERFTILKAIAIICVVMSHAGIRGWLFSFVFMFHVPVFFLCAGYFFHTKYLNDERTFLMHRIKGLYWPFVKWSVFFLVVHNLLFSTGILNESYGNAMGGTLHPLTWHQFGQNLWNIVTQMSGYNEFLCGSYWFFRSLFLASIAFLIVFKLVRKSEHFRSDIQAGGALLAVGLLLTFWQVADHLHVSGVAQGGYRELMGFTFMAAGFLLRQYRVIERTNLWIALGCLAVLVGASFWCPTSMVWKAELWQFFALPLPAVAAFVALAYGCGYIERGPRLLRRSLVYIGDRTLYIFAFHLVAFKVVSALKAAFYDLPWLAVGGHPTVLNPPSNLFWILLYTIAGVGLPLLWLAGYRKVSAHVTVTEKQAVEALFKAVSRFCRMAVVTGQVLWRICCNIYRSFIQGIKDIIEASSTKDE